MRNKLLLVIFVLLLSTSVYVPPVNAVKTVILGVPWEYQHKDTPMLCLQGCDYTGDHAWDAEHLEHRTHGDMYCVRASISMIANYFNNKKLSPPSLSQDRVTYFMTSGSERGPEFDLKHSETATPLETLAWALGVPVDVILEESYNAIPYQPGNLNLFKEALDDGRPILACWNGHARVIDGYKLGNNFDFHVLDPWPITEPTDSEKWLNFGNIPVGAYLLIAPAQAPGVKHDEETIWLDSDGDLLCDFDEIDRFHTDPFDPDSDNDGISDKNEILSYTYDYWGDYGPGYYYDYIIQKLTEDYPATVDGIPVAIYNLRGNTPIFPASRYDFATGDLVGWHTNEPLIELIALRADMDQDGLRAELDYDSDGDGIPDNVEDKNRNGFFEWWLYETNPHIWDTTPPTTTLGVTPDYFYGESGTKYITQDTVHTLTATEDPRSLLDVSNGIFDRENEINTGVLKTAYRVYPVAFSGDPPSFSDYGEPFTITGETGEYIIEYYSIDKHGNREPTNTVHETISDITVLEQQQVYIEGATYTFNPFFDDPVPEAYTLQWDFGPSVPIKTGKTPFYSFPNNGLYPITLQSYDGLVLKNTKTLQATVLDTTPVADFSYTGILDEGATIHFLDESSPGNDVIVSWSWDFNGKGSSSLQNPDFSFPDNGLYKVSLTVTDDDGSQSTVVKELGINNVAPTALINSVSSVNEGDKVEFQLHVSDPGYFDYHLIEWDFGDGSIFGGFGDEHDDPYRPVHRYQENGEFTVIVRVEDDDGGVDVESTIVVVNNVAPSVEAGTDQTVNEGDLVSFTGTFSDPGSVDTHTVEWDFGDAYTTSGTLTPTHTYADNGVFSVTLTVTDDDGGVETDTVGITVSNVAPTLDPVGDKNSPWGELLEFTATATDTGDDILTFNLGISAPSGATITTDGYFAWTPTSSQIGTHTFIVLVTDDDGASVSEEITVEVDKRDTSLEYTGDLSGEYSDPITVSASLSDKLDGTPLIGKTITFTIGTQTTSGVTDIYGIVSATITLDQQSGPYTETTMFAGDTDYASTTESELFTINKERVWTIEYTGDTNIRTIEGEYSAIVDLSAILTQQKDGFPGNLELVHVTFIIDPVDPHIGSKVIVKGVPVENDGGTYTAKTSATAEVEVGLYNVIVFVEQNPYFRQNRDEVSLFVSNYGEKETVTGGGWIEDEMSVNGKGNFGFSVKYNKKGNAKGSFVYIYRTEKYIYRVKSNSWKGGGLSFTAEDRAFFFGRCTIQTLDRETGETVDSIGNSRFIVSITDADMDYPQREGTDSIAFTFLLPDEDVWGLIGTYDDQIPIGNGNIVIHR